MRPAAVASILLVGVVTTAHAADRSGVRPEVMALPSGPGSIEGLGESFDASPQSGAASYSVPIRVPPAVGGFAPSLALSYSSGGGNGELGLGWSLGQPVVQRSTDRRLPAYDDSDVFVLRGMGGAGAEDLLEQPDGSYRFRIEGAFARGERQPDGTWEFRNKSGIRFVFGEGSAATVRDGERVFSWHLTRQIDTHGNAIAYEYERDETDRPYLTRIVYNDFSPSVRNEIVLVYEARPDELTSYVSTFAVTTARRLSRIEVRHGGQPVLTYTLGYEMAMDLSRLASVHLVGRDGVTDLPVLRLSYAEPSTDAADVVTMVDGPARALGQVAEIDDVDGDALPDLLLMDPSLDGGRYSWYPNLDGGSFGARQVMTASPSVWLDSTGVQLADMDGDGAADVVARLSSAADGFRYYPAGANGEFGGAVTITPNPSFAFDDPDVRLVDLDHDRLSDWLRIDPSTGEMYAGFNQGGGVFSTGINLGRLDPAEVLSFSGGDLSLADMNGDGLTDLVAVRSVSARYWPAMGGGQFDEVVVLPGAPVLSGTELSELQIRDLNGDGLADLVHVGVNQVRWWRNVAGSSLAVETSIVGTPERRPTTVVRVADMNGNGSGDIVWMDPADVTAPWRYLDVLGDGSPGLLTRIDNGLGKVVTVEYAGLGNMRGWARAEAVPWTRRCPVGQHVVAQVAVDDSLGNVVTTQYRYADAYYDGPMREVRGFARAVTYALGDAEQPTLVSEASFDVGDGDEARKGITLSTTRRREAGAIFDVVTTAYEVRALDGGARFAVPVQRDTEIFEGGASGRLVRSTWDYDEHGNVVFEAAYGEVVAGDVAAGDDERIVERSFAVDEARWMLDRVATEVVRSLDGDRVAETRTYYDGDPHRGLPLGQVGEHGDVARVTSWIEADDFALDQSVARDAYGNAIAVVDGRGGRTETSYDPNSHTFATSIRKLTDGEHSLEWTAEYDEAFGVATEIVDQNGQRQAAVYDGLGRIVALVQPGDTLALPTQRYEYVLGNPVSYVRSEQREQSGSEGAVVRFGYVDGLGRTRGTYQEASDSRWLATGIVQFGARGLARFVQHPMFVNSADLGSIDEAQGGVWTSYDATGRAVSRREADGTERRTVYGPMTATEYDENDADASSEHFATPTTKVSDGLGRLRSIVELDGTREVRTAFDYDPLGNLNRAIDANGNARRYAFDGRARLRSVDDPNAGIWSYSYDDADGMLDRIDGSGNRVRFERDLLGRTTAEYHRLASDAEEALSVRWHYDGRADGCPAEFANLVGQVSRIDDDAGDLCLGYDARGRQTDELRRWADGGEHYTWTEYDAAGRITRRGFPDGTYLPVEYDEQGLVRSIGGVVNDVTWTAWRTRGAIAFGNGVVDEREYDERLRPTRMKASGAEGVLRDLSLVYDKASLVRAVIDRREGVETAFDLSADFDYDDRYRLIASRDRVGATTWRYDDVAKVLAVESEHEAPHLNVTNTYGERGAGPDQLTSFGAESIEYDAAGRVVRDGTRAYEWDAKGRLARVVRGDVVEEYTYAHDDSRIVKVTDGPNGASKALYLGADVEVRDGKLVRYVMLDGDRIARLDAYEEPMAASGLSSARGLRGASVLGVLFVLGWLAVGLRGGGSSRGGIVVVLVMVFVGGVTCGGAAPCYVHDGRPVDTWPSTAVLYLTDYQGSVVAVVDSDGDLVREAAYDAYGSERATRGRVAEAYGHVGNEADRGSGLGHFGARPYRFDAGVFLKVEPMVFEPTPAVHVYAYCYAAGNPATLQDESGERPVPGGFGNEEVARSSTRSAGDASDLVTSIGSLETFSEKYTLLTFGAGLLTGSPVFKFMGDYYAPGLEALDELHAEAKKLRSVRNKLATFEAELERYERMGNVLSVAAAGFPKDPLHFLPSPTFFVDDPQALGSYVDGFRKNLGAVRSALQKQIHMGDLYLQGIDELGALIDQQAARSGVGASAGLQMVAEFSYFADPPIGDPRSRIRAAQEQARQALRRTDQAWEHINDIR